MQHKIQYHSIAGHLILKRTVTEEQWILSRKLGQFHNHTKLIQIQLFPPTHPVENRVYVFLSENTYTHGIVTTNQMFEN